MISHEGIEAGDVGICRFTELRAMRSGDAVKARPCLVLCVDKEAALVAPGSSQVDERVFADCLYVTAPNQMKAAGIRKPTAFKLRSAGIVPVRGIEKVGALDEVSRETLSISLGTYRWLHEFLSKRAALLSV